MRLEKIKLETQTPIDIDQLRGGSDLVAELLAAVHELRHDDTKLYALAEELAPLATGRARGAPGRGTAPGTAR